MIVAGRALFVNSLMEKVDLQSEGLLATEVMCNGLCKKETRRMTMAIIRSDRSCEMLKFRIHVERSWAKMTSSAHFCITESKNSAP